MNCKKYYENDPEKYVEMRNRQKRAWRLRTGSAPSIQERVNKGMYTCEEDKLVLAHSIPDRELAKKLGRSVQSIQIRRNRLKNGREE